MKKIICISAAALSALSLLLIAGITVKRRISYK